MKVMKLKLLSPFQGPGRGPSNAFKWFYIFVKFTKVKYFSQSRFSLLSLSTLDLPSVTLSIVSGGIGVAAGMFAV
jgi:hypothetical protein